MVVNTPEVESALIAEPIACRWRSAGYDNGYESVIVFGVGSYTMNYNTRDSLGIAVKATYQEVNGVGYELFKAPKTDSGMKNSAKGLLRVEFEDGNFVLYEQQTKEQEEQGCLKTVFEDGKLLVDESFDTIRNRLWNN